MQNFILKSGVDKERTIRYSGGGGGRRAEIPLKKSCKPSC